MGSSERSLYHALLASTAFASRIKLCLSRSMSFHMFTLLILSPLPLVESE